MRHLLLVPVMVRSLGQPVFGQAAIEIALESGSQREIQTRDQSSSGC